MKKLNGITAILMATAALSACGSQNGDQMNMKIDASTLIGSSEAGSGGSSSQQPGGQKQ